ncbi:MAG: ribonuclease III domain-containing protein [Cyanobacteriota bacterium]
MSVDSPCPLTLKQQVAQLDEGSRRDKAWLGDAVLSLFARQWLLGLPQKKPLPFPSPPSCDLTRTELFTWITSNQFLSAFGDPTRVEAEIGLLYENEGLQAAFVHIQEHLLPLFLKQVNNRSKALRTSRR